MYQRRTILWGSLLGGLGLIILGSLLLIDQSSGFLPDFIQLYWPALLIVSGLWILIARLRFTEDAWAGMDYGTGLYVIRHRRQGRPGLLSVFLLLGLGAFFLWANLTPAANVTITPLLVLALGVIFSIRSFL